MRAPLPEEAPPLAARDVWRYSVTTSTTSQAKRETRAAASAGRAAGYCWVEHPEGGAHCTRLPGHYPRLKHKDYYNRGGEEYS